MGGLTALAVSWLSLLILVGAGFLVLQKVQLALADARLDFLAEAARVAAANGIAPLTGATAADRNGLAADLAGHFRLPVLLAVFLPLGHATAALWFVLRLRRIRWSWPWQAANWTAFFGTSLLLTGILASLHATEAQIRAETIGASLGQAMAEHKDSAALFSAFAALDPGIAATVVAQDDSAKPAPDWSRDYHFALDDHRILVLTQSLPGIFSAPVFLQSVKSLLVLTFAIALPVGLFRHIDGSPNRCWHYRPRRRRSASGDADAALSLIRIIYFLAVLSENLVASFLPRLLKEVAASAQLPPSFASALFMTYFFSFAASLIPAGQLAGRTGPKPLIWGGCALSAAAMILPALSLEAAPMMAARLLAGLGQGVLMIGVQSYILEAAPAGRKTQGAGIIVYGFNAGMISGLAIGSLLLDRIGQPALFVLAALIACATALFALLALPSVTVSAPARPKRGLLLLWRKLHAGQARRKSEQTALGDLGLPQPDGHGLRSLLSADFVKTTLLIGIPAKGILTGVILFALPLLLTHQGLESEEIGQIVMFYAMGVLAANRIVARLADRRGRTGAILFTGSLLSGAGLIMIGVTGWPPASGLLGQGAPLVLLMVLSVLVIGVAHGFINAPVVTHIADLPSARQIGSARAAATYRFLERLGHVTGPLIIDRVMTFGSQGAASMIWVGAAVGVFSLLFVLRLGNGEARTASHPPGEA